MRCVFIVSNDPISPNYRGGGSAIYYEQLNSLIELGIDVFLWHFCYDSRAAEFEQFIMSESDDWTSINAVCARVYRTRLSDTPTAAERFYNRSVNFFTRNDIRNPLIRGKCFSQFKEILAEVEPDLIWAQHLVAAQVSQLQRRVPVVYSHHDWLYKIKSQDPQRNWDIRAKKFEETTARKAAAVVSGSMVECKQLSEVGCVNVHYISVAYDAAPISLSGNGAKPRIVHLGGMGTTASRIGLERFFDVVWQGLDKGAADFWVVGDLSSAPDKIKKDLAKATCTGYVKDLNGILRPYDIHIIPWEHETGQRTRLVQAFNYGQAVVATKRSVACFPEAVDGENCILVDSLDEMPFAINRCLMDDDLRIRLGNRSRQTFETCFTRQVLLPKYEKVIESIVR